MRIAIFLGLFAIALALAKEKDISSDGAKTIAGFCLFLIALDVIDVISVFVK